MSSWDWLGLVWLALALAMMVSAMRAHRIGGRRMLVMALAWLAIFLAAAAIASFVVEQVAVPEAIPPLPEGVPNLT
jgi:predicted aspartyl protease